MKRKNTALQPNIKTSSSQLQRQEKYPPQQANEKKSLEKLLEVPSKESKKCKEVRNSQSQNKQCLQQQKKKYNQNKQLSRLPSLNKTKLSKTQRLRSLYIDHRMMKFPHQFLIMNYGPKEIYIDNSETQKDQKKQQKTHDVKQTEADELVESCVRVVTEETQNSSTNYKSRIATSLSTVSLGSNNEYSYFTQPEFYMHPQTYQGILPEEALNQPYQTIQQETLQPRRRNRASMQVVDPRKFAILVDRVDIDGRTTIMIKNIPNKYSQEMLCELYKKKYQKKFDFFYLPMDHDSNCNVGYAFMNFLLPSFIVDFYEEFHNKKWKKFNSLKICEIRYATIQGRNQLEKHFEHSMVLNQIDSKFRPMFRQNNKN